MGTGALCGAGAASAAHVAPAMAMAAAPRAKRGRAHPKRGRAARLLKEAGEE